MYNTITHETSYDAMQDRLGGCHTWSGSGSGFVSIFVQGLPGACPVAGMSGGGSRRFANTIRAAFAGSLNRLIIRIDLGGAMLHTFHFDSVFIICSRVPRSGRETCF
jgi:hypothetical protein